MNKPELVSALAKEANITVLQSRRVVREFCNIIKRTLMNGEEVSLPQFGKFYTIETKTRKMPHTLNGESKILPPKTVPKFKFYETAKEDFLE